MTAPPQIITRTLTFEFAPSINASTSLPDIMEVALIPLSDSTNATAGATFAGGLKTVDVELTSPGPNLAVFNLVPSYSNGNDNNIRYRVMWRAGVMGRTETKDFSMPDADLTWDQLVAGVGNIITDEVYLQQVDLGVPGRVARLNEAGQVIDSNGTPVASSTDITVLENTLTAETNAREAAVGNLNSNLQASIATQVASTLSTAESYTSNQIGTVNADIAVERSARISADNDLQTQVTNNRNAANTTLATHAGEIDGINTALNSKADLDDNGFVPLDQIPPEILTNAIPAANQAAMLALSPSVAHKGDLAIRPDGIYLLITDDPTQLSNWVSLSIVSSVNSKRGDVVLNAADVGAIALGASITQSQVTGLGTALSNKANQTDLNTANATIASIQNDSTIVHTVAGVVPYTLLDSHMVYLNDAGQLVHKDGTIIPLGSGGSGAVFSVNTKTGLVVLTASDVGAMAIGASVSQSQVTGLSTSLSNKADLTSGVLSASQVPTNIAQSSITGLSTALSAKADLVSSLVPLAQIPSLPQSQITGLPVIISNNSLTSSSNAINRIASLESQIVTLGGGGGGGGGVGTQAEFWTSSNTTTAVIDTDFTPDVNLHSPWGIDSDGSITGTIGTWYYLYTGVRGADAAFSYISANGHLNLRKWNESGPADPVYALSSDLATLTTTVGTKASASDLSTTNATVATKANQTDLTALSTTVDTKANATDLTSLATSVGLKASQNDLNTTNTTMATLATQAALATTNAAVALKANQTDMTAAQTAITTNATALTTKADLVSGVLKSSQIPTTIPQTSVTGLSTALTAKADLVSGTVPLSQVPTNIPQTSITGLGTALGAKADLISGVIPLSQIPMGALPNVAIVANRAAMLALTSAQVQYGDLCLISSGVDMGTYVLNDPDPSQFSHWVEISNANAPVTSVNTLTGDVVLTASSVGALGASAAIPQSQITGLTTALGTFATTSALTTGLAGKTAFSDVQSMITASSFVKRADYVSSSAIASLSGQQSVDGVLTPIGAIVLATAQSSSINNGLWVVSSGSWSRASDFSTGSYLSKDTIVVVSNQTASANGTAANATMWQETAASGFIDTAASNWLKIGNTAAPFAPTGTNGVAVTGSAFTANVLAGGGILAPSGGLQRDPNVVPGKFIATLPGGSTVVGVTHNLNNSYPNVTIWDTTSNTLVLAGVTSTSANSVSIEFASAPATGQYRVQVIG